MKGVRDSTEPHTGTCIREISCLMRGLMKHARAQTFYPPRGLPPPVKLGVIVADLISSTPAIQSRLCAPLTWQVRDVYPRVQRLVPVVCFLFYFSNEFFNLSSLTTNGNFIRPRGYARIYLTRSRARTRNRIKDISARGGRESSWNFPRCVM